MPTTIRDAQNSIMKGSAKYANWKKNFYKNWTQPEMELEIAKFWKGVPAVVKEWYKKNKPEIYKDMNKKYGGE